MDSATPENGLLKEVQEPTAVEGGLADLQIFLYDSGEDREDCDPMERVLLRYPGHLSQEQVAV